MTTTVTRHRRPTNQKRVSNGFVFLRYAEERKIAKSTAADWFYGKVGSPLYDVDRMAAVAARHGRLDMVEGFIQRLRAASTTPNELTPALVSQAQIADFQEDLLEEAFRANPNKGTWVVLKRAKLAAIALEQKMIAAGDRTYG